MRTPAVERAGSVPASPVYQITLFGGGAGDERGRGIERRAIDPHAADCCVGAEECVAGRHRRGGRQRAAGDAADGRGQRRLQVGRRCRRIRADGECVRPGRVGMSSRSE